MAKNSKLDTLSSNFFFSGIVVGRVAKLCPPIINQALFILGNLLYLAGYISWKVSIHQDETNRYGLSSSQKEQFDKEFQQNPFYMIAALFGILACTVTLLNIPTAMTALSTSWLFASSNICWLQAETLIFNQLCQNQPGSLAHTAQGHYYKYTNLATIISLISSLSLTLCIVFPLATPAISLVSVVTLITLNIFAIQSWVKSSSAFRALKADRPPEAINIEETESYELLNRKFPKQVQTESHTNTASQNLLIQSPLASPDLTSPPPVLDFIPSP